ncbi:hypothetical protein EXIGLDRAFT_777422 [Exidia glandulosa HHB12029]|uniref:Uncharacterized protein n=1 Tax=Exidia glandulosa HHB12029 TaxID=1314781 RepID=A0A165D0W8_EXIGL|nr:hypothetical protein EXIGLDRAFT_777422 [Exidia glandulosa HHB12029]
MFKVLAVVFLAALAQAAPAASPNATLQKRSPGVFYTTDINWGGAQTHVLNVVIGRCYTLPSNSVSSFGPDSGLQCFGYISSNCSGGERFGPIVNPGVSTLADWQRQLDMNWNDKMNSFKCQGD